MTTANDTKLSGGVYTLLSTPFNEDGSLFDSHSMSREIDYILEGGVDGLVACGKAGEFEGMNLNEIEQVLDHVLEHVNGRVPVGMGIISVDLDDAMKAAKIASRKGASFAMVKKRSYKDLHSFFLKIADEIPVMLYDMTNEGKLNMQRDVLPIVNDCDRIAALKVSGDIGSFEVLKHETLSIPALCGSDMYSLITYLCGSDGVIAGSAAVMPDHEVVLYKLVKAEKWDEAREHFYNKMLPLIIFITPDPYAFSVAKHLLKWKGIIDHATTRPPYPKADDWHLEEVKKLAIKLKIIEK